VSLDLDIIAAVDARIAAALKESTAWGTVAARLGWNDAMVTFDGSSLGIPVKVAGNVEVLEGDRVGLLKIGPWWTVVTTMTRRFLNQQGAQQSQVTGATTTSASFVDTSDYCGCNFTKRWNETAIFAQVTGSCYVDAEPTRVDFGVKFTDQAQGSSTYTVVSSEYDVINSHVAVTDWIFITDKVAGAYEAHVQWCRPLAGTATLRMNGFDLLQINLVECSPVGT
jgi:hypothetical protein